MERINGLCRALAVCALTMLLAVGQFGLLEKSEAAKQAEEVLSEQIYEIQTALNEDHKEKIVLFKAGSLSEDFTQEQLDQMISAWIKKAADGRTYSKKAISEMQKEITALYKKQKEIASDPVYTAVFDRIFYLSVAVLIICNLNVLFTHVRNRKTTRANENNIASEAKESADSFISDEENSTVSNDNINTSK
ncbi:MAG: hypothetical protein HFE82_00100 [Erysipelotrichaceae bacterium]|nr:hypothetical protein [Erysipelotrichaceae bacterium]